MYKRLTLTLALVICAGVLLFPLTAHAEGEIPETAAEADIDPESIEDGDSDIESVSGINTDELFESLDLSSLFSMLPGGGMDSSKPENRTPDGTGTVMDNVFIYGNDLQFFTFTTEASNVFYLVIDRSRTKDNVYFLNAVTEQDLVALAEKKGGSVSTSGIPSTTGDADGRPARRSEVRRPVARKKEQ